MWRITLLDSGNLVDTYTFAGTESVTVGRADDNQIVLNALGVKKHHARVILGDGWEIMALEGTVERKGFDDAVIGRFTLRVERR